MASPQSSALLLLVFFTCFYLLTMRKCYAAEPEPLSPSKNPTTLQDIKDFCTEMRYPRLCVDSLKSDSRSFKVFSGILPNISMNIAMANATAICSAIQNALKTEPQTLQKRFLILCAESFGVAAKNIETAIQLYKFPMEPFGSPINGLLSTAEGNVTDCQNKLKNHGVQSALLPQIVTAKKLIIVAADLIRNEEL